VSCLAPPLRSGAKQLEASVPVSSFCGAYSGQLGSSAALRPKLTLVPASCHVEGLEVELGRLLKRQRGISNAQA
jgi:hypothetical protein